MSQENTKYEYHWVWFKEKDNQGHVRAGWKIIKTEVKYGQRPTKADDRGSEESAKGKRD